MLAGSDAGADFSYHGFGLHDELAQLRGGRVHSRWPRYSAATVRAATFSAVTAAQGAIVAGAEADLVLIEGNPLTDITASLRVHGVMTRGTWLTRTDLDRMMENARLAAAAVARADATPRIAIGASAAGRHTARKRATSCRRRASSTPTARLVRRRRRCLAV